MGGTWICGGMLGGRVRGRQVGAIVGSMRRMMSDVGKIGWKKYAGINRREKKGFLRGFFPGKSRVG